MVVVHKVALFHLVVGHLYATAQFGHHHYLDIFILYKHHLPLLGRRFIGYRLDDRVGIHHATRPLIHALLKKNRVLLCLPDFVGRDGHYFSPGFYTHNITVNDSS